MTQLTEDERLARAVLRLNGTVVGFALGTVSGLTLFLATMWLVVKGGHPVGPHLSLLNQFFYGYSVTFAGSFIGMAYGFVCGFFGGWFIAWVYNKVANAKQRFLEGRR